MSGKTRRSFVKWSSILAVFIAGAGVSALLKSVFAQEGPDWHKGLPRQHKSKWLVHDLRRPLPPVVTPGENPGDPPSDAIVLFGGKDLSGWKKNKDPEPENWKPAEWKVEKGYTEQNNTGGIFTKEEFGDCQLHIEWRTPSPPKGRSQGRGNSGILFMTHYEVQVLDSYQSRSYADGTAASVYGQHPPLYNACRKPGEWQTYDIVFRRPRFNDDRTLREPARVTLFHNGVLVLHNTEVFGRVRWRGLATYSWHKPKLPLMIQDHGDRQPMRFRNIWIRRLDLTPEPAE